MRQQRHARPVGEPRSPRKGSGRAFVYHITKALGVLTAVLGGIDALVFTAGIGEHAPEIRERVCREAGWLGIRLDPAANAAGGPRISTPESSVSAWVIPTDEERMIALHTWHLLKENETRQKHARMTETAR